MDGFYKIPNAKLGELLLLYFIKIIIFLWGYILFLPYKFYYRSLCSSDNIILLFFDGIQFWTNGIFWGTGFILIIC
jgi:hypothetical protein